MLSLHCAKLQEENEEQNEVEAQSPKRKGHKRKARTPTQETDCEDRYRKQEAQKRLSISIPSDSSFCHAHSVYITKICCYVWVRPAVVPELAKLILTIVGKACGVTLRKFQCVLS